MKRVGYLYDKICDLDNIKAAIKHAADKKRDRREVARVLRHIDYYAQLLRDMLVNKTYALTQGKHKRILDGSQMKIRDITIPVFFPDQVIHWSVMQILTPLFMKSMYRYSCGSVPGRGGKEVKHYLDRIIRTDKQIAYVGKFDVRKYFPSVDHDKLKELLRRKIKCPDTLKLLDDIIDIGGPGLPIGYYSSQWLSNFYLEQVDHYIKEVIGIKYYIRYVDDMVLIDYDKEKIHKSRLQIDEYLRTNNYRVQLKDNWQVWKIWSRPIDFVGYRYYGTYTKMRKRLFYRLHRICKNIGTKGMCIPRARRASSLFGWTKRINFRNYYVQRLKPYISRGAINKYISVYDKKHKEQK